MTTLTNKIRDERLFFGGMNSDDDPRFLPEGDYIDAVNLSVNEDGSGGVLVNLKGNDAIYTKSGASTSEKLCGWAYYKKNESVILFIYATQALPPPDDVIYKIVEFNPQTEVATTILQNLLLEFHNPQTTDYFIKADILDDWLAWTDNINPPRMINIQNPPLSSEVSTSIDLNKLPPLHPLGLSTELDDTVVYNNITKPYQFKYRYVYDDFRASVYNPGSDIIISDVISRVDEDFTLTGQENYINVQFNSGNPNVSTIDIAVREGNIGGWFRFIKIDKDSPENIYTTGGVLVTVALSDDTDYVYRFYNNEGRFAIGDDGTKQYDRVPEKSESLTFLGDNRLGLGGNTEGKDLIDIDVTLTPLYNNPGLFDSLPIDSTNDTGVNLTVNFDLGATFLTRGKMLVGDYVYFNYAMPVFYAVGGDNAEILDTYFVFNETIDGTIDDIGAYIATNFDPGVGIVVAYDSGSDEIRITHTMADTIVSVGAAAPDNSLIFNRGYEYFTSFGYINDLAFKRGYSHKLALIYQDKYGVKYPALVSGDTNVPIDTIASSSAGFAHIQYTINNTAPSDAVSYRWAYAYTPKSFVQTYITDVSYFEDPDGDLNTKLIALDISANSQFYPPNYTVQVGDYIKIIEEGGSNSSLSGVYVDNAPEFIIEEIKDTIDDGTNVLSGTWLVVKPSNVTGYDYDTVGATSLFMNALIEVYKLPDTNVDTAYYEIGGGGTCVGGTTDHDDWHSGTSTGHLNQGDIWVRPVTRYSRSGAGRTAITKIVSYLEDPFPYKNAPTKDVGIADPNVEFPESRNKYDNIIRWSNKFFQDTQINGLSSFDFDSKKDVSDTFGKIKGLEQLGQSLVVICEKKVLSGGVGYTEYLDASGNVNQVKSDSVIGHLRASNERYGTYLKESILNTGKYIYFFDLYNKAVIRKAYNGLFPISGVAMTPNGAVNYKMRSYYSQLSDSLIDSVTGGDIWDVKVYMGYDVYYENVYITFDDKNTVTNNVSLIFNEPTRRWKSRYTGYSSGQSLVMYPWTDSTFMSFFTNSLYRQDDDTVDRCLLYGLQEESLLRFISNKTANEEKVFNNIAVFSNDIWKANADDAIIIPAKEAYRETGSLIFRDMSSKILDGNWRLEEGIYISNFLRDGHTTSDNIKLIDLYNGNLLRGSFIDITMTNNNTDITKIFKINVESELTK